MTIYYLSAKITLEVTIMPEQSKVLFKTNDNLYRIFQTYGERHTFYAHEKDWFPDENYIYLIQSGILKVYASDNKGNEKFLWVIGQGSLIPTFYSKTAKRLYILTTTTILKLDKNTLVKAFAANEKLFESFMKQIYARYEEILARNVENSSERSINKLCQLLYEVAKISSNNTENVKIKNYLSRQDMAYYVGTHVTNISKLLKQLEFDGLIKRDGREITITDTEKLKNYFAE